MSAQEVAQSVPQAFALEEAQQLLEAHGWEVKRPPFDDPYEVMWRRLQYEAGGGDAERYHPVDNPMSPEYEWGEYDKAALAFLKRHFVLKSELESGC